MALMLTFGNVSAAEANSLFGLSVDALIQWQRRVLREFSGETFSNKSDQPTIVQRRDGKLVVIEPSSSFNFITNTVS